MAPLSIEDLKGEFRLRYLVEDEGLENVRRLFAQKYGAEFSPKQYKDKIAEWQMRKNLKKEVVEAVLKAREGREDGFDFYVGQQLIDMERIERFQRRYKTGLMKNEDDGDKKKDTKDSTLPSIVNDLVHVRRRPRSPIPLASPEAIEIPEIILYRIDHMVRKSFDTRKWFFFDNERLIESSNCAHLERSRLNTFLTGVDLGCDAACVGKHTLAEEHWTRAFSQLEDLITGRMHDIVPNIMVKLNDLIDRDHPEVARWMIEKIRRLCQIYAPEGHPYAIIFKYLHLMDLKHLPYLESEIWKILHTLFAHHVGSRCFNTFVMLINGAERELNRDGQSDIDTTCPELSPLEQKYGIANSRAMHVLLVKIETMYKRQQYAALIPIARNLRWRANSKVNDPWQRNWYMIKALLFGGRAHVQLGNFEGAKQWLQYCLYLERIFTEEIDNSGQFDASKIVIQDILRSIEVISEVST